MDKAERIKRYGKEGYKKQLGQNRAWNKAHREELIANNTKYREDHPEEEKARSQEVSRKGGRRYAKKLEYNHTGLQGDKNKIRSKHQYKYKPYKAIIAPESQLHHEWIPDTSEYRGVALVEKEPHQYGIVDVIEILDGEITLLTEEEVKNGGDII